MKTPFDSGLPVSDVNHAKSARNWCLAFVLTNFVATVLAKPEAQLSAAAVLCVTGLHVGVCCGLFRAYRRFLRHLDELQKKIQLDALAFALGIGFFGASIFSIFLKPGFISKMDVDYLMALMGIVFVGGLVVGKYRYQ